MLKKLKLKFKAFVVNAISERYYKKYPKYFNDLAENAIKLQTEMLAECRDECVKQGFDLIVMIDSSTLPMTFEVHGGYMAEEGKPNLSVIKGDKDE